jgi:putative transcriptional regulator
MGGHAVSLLKFKWREQSEPAGEPLHYRACGLDHVYLLNGFKPEVVDGEEYLTIADMDDLWKAIGLHLVKTRKELARKDIRFLRHHMNLTQAELGAQMRVADQTVARWEKGITPLPGPEDMLLRVLFLGSKISQPEGGAVLQEIVKLAEEIREHDDEPTAKPVAFEHGKKKWKEAAARELEPA